MTHRRRLWISLTFLTRDGEPHVTVRARRDIIRESIRRRQHEAGEDSGREIITPDSIVGLIAEPDVAIGAGSDAHGRPEKGKLDLGNIACWRDKGDLPGRAFTEPDTPIGARSNEGRVAQTGSHEVTDHAARVMRVTSLLLERVNQKLASAPMVMEKGWLPCWIGKERVAASAWDSDYHEAEAKFRVKLISKGVNRRPGPTGLIKVSYHHSDSGTAAFLPQQGISYRVATFRDNRLAHRRG